MATFEQIWPAIQVGENGNGNGGGITFAVGENKVINAALKAIIPQITEFTPDPGSGGSSVDGRVARVIWNQTWSQIRNGDGTQHDTGQAQASVLVSCLGMAGLDPMFDAIHRIIMTFPTQLLPATAVVLGARLRVYVTNIIYQPVADYSVGVFESNPTFINDLENLDYDHVGGIPCSDRFFMYQLQYAGNPIGFVEFTLNTYGISKIVPGEVTKLALREATYDAPNITPPGVAGDNTATFAMADNANGAWRPTLLLELV